MTVNIEASDYIETICKILYDIIEGLTQLRWYYLREKQEEKAEKLWKILVKLDDAHGDLRDFVG